MKYFLHDSNSFNDEKISELFMNFGYEGLGLFYSILEKIASQEKPIKTTVLKSQLKVGKRLDKCWLFMESLGIINTLNGETFNERLLTYSETYQIKKEKNAKRILQWREKQQIIENVTRSESVSNTPKVKVSKGIVSKENIINDIISGDKSPKQKTFKNFSEKEFIEELSKFKGQFEKDLLNSFFKYWKELSPGGKMKFQLEKTWETKLRLEKWQSNQFKFKNNGTTVSNGQPHGAKSAGAYQLLAKIKEQRGIE